MNLYFILAVLKCINAVVAVIMQYQVEVVVSMIHMQNYVFNVVKDINVKVFYIMSRTNEKRYIGCHKACRCKRRLNASVCNNKQR